MSDFLRRHSWLIPIAFAVVLGVVGATAHRALEATMKAELRSKLETILDAEVAALEIWADEKKAIAEVYAGDPRVRDAVQTLLQRARQSEDPAAALRASPALAGLRAILEPVIERHRFAGFGVLEPGGRLVAAARDPLVGTRPRDAALLLDQVLEGRSAITPPLRWTTGGLDVDLILVGAPVQREDGRIVALFGFSILPEQEFKQILTIARPGQSGETYAFDADGLLVSASRFDDQLREIGLLPQDPEVTSFRNIQIRDPGGDLTKGHAPELPAMARPLTRMAADAVSGNRGIDVEGYRDYRGVPVVGAWTWLPSLGIGVTTELDVEEAYQGLLAVQSRFWAVIVLMVVAAVGMFLYSFVLVRLRSKVDEARQLGRYRIERKLGSGGMGTVYLASHALLRRPTAIKILRSEAGGREALARFEREVQVSSSLTHPNTIEIYDYGHTPDGTFYYAMEYLRGLTLGACVEGDGAQSEARVVHVMKQACASIAEAHAAGLMHRDLKPSNIMLCERGGMFDFVKVLDFGLVKPQAATRDLALTDVASLTGTPLYMAPESVQTPEELDVRGDVYQLGAIAYFLLAGRHLFSGDSAYEVMARHVSVQPEPPSKALGRPLSAELERIVLACLEKRPDDRPKDAGELLAALETCAVSSHWGQREARAWWAAWRERHPDLDAATPDTGTHPSAYTVDVASRLQEPSTPDR